MGFYLQKEMPVKPSGYESLVYAEFGRNIRFDV